MIEDTRDDRGLWKTALWTVPLIVGVGSLSGYLSNSGFHMLRMSGLSRPFAVEYTG